MNFETGNVYGLYRELLKIGTSTFDISNISDLGMKSIFYIPEDKKYILHTHREKKYILHHSGEEKYILHPSSHWR